MIQSQRIKPLNRKSARPGRYVLYWMQASQRAEYNHALEYAVRQANHQGLPLVVVFGLTDRFPEANVRHYVFMLEGLKETRDSLAKRGIPLVVRKASPDKACLQLAKEAALVVTDRGYLRIQQAWRAKVALTAPCSVLCVESDVIVPVETASPKEEFSAGTFRPKIHRCVEEFMVPLRKIPVRGDASRLSFEGLDLTDISALIKKLRVDKSIRPSPHFRGGTSQAKKRLKAFIREHLDDYGEKRNDPSLGCLSHMSPYLHFGQISPLYIALEVEKAAVKNRASRSAYLEELIVRRELSMNYLFYNPRYDEFEALPAWAKKTLNQHSRDPRDYLYTLEGWEAEQTHDPHWNAAQAEMRITGKMHGYMRMYWGKKILEWSRSPKEAFRIALHLNNKYELDGRDPNGFTGVAWCFGKHDRAWGERPVYGKVRSMVASGLRRKFDIDAYVRRVESLKEEEA
ncbi:deoxyribodipyrimidine photo-lyase [bacterium]|nr:deoxyribodipyrimidine photo-lyase [bacterium]